jgi:hypothetical protein
MNAFLRLLPAFLIGLISVGCASASHPERGAMPAGTVTHVVIMYLNDRGDLTARSELIRAANTLRTIKGVQSAWAGRMLTSSNPVVDQSYDVAFVLTFADQEALEHYNNDPLHQQTKKQLLDRYVRKYLVYDFVSE